MPGYLFVNVEQVTNPSAFEEYGKASIPVIDKYRGRILALRTRSAVVEGEMKGRVGLIEFPSYEEALNFYNSPEYKALKQIRDGAAKCTIVVLEGTLN